MSTSTELGLVSPSDIADIAGVSRGAVSNWRKREKDTFPQPVAGTVSKPLFSRQEVNAWLEARGYTPKQDVGETAVWAAMNLLRGQLSVDEATDLILSLLIARKSGTIADHEQVQIPWNLRHQVQGIIQRVDVDQLGPVADFALERLAKSLGKAGADFGFVGSRTTRILANLAAARPGGVLYDPACGIAAALLEAVALGAKPDRVIGHEVNQRALHIAAQRAQLYDVPVELVRSDVLSDDVDPSLRADVIILEPPFNLKLDTPWRLMDARFDFGTPPRSSADTAWLQHVVAHLSESGRGYVLTSHGALFRGAAEGRIRAELLRHGCVEAIVGLPGKLLPHTAIPLALWVLRRPQPPRTPGQILLIDASGADAPEDHVVGWLTDPAARSAVPHVEVSVTDVLAADAVLSPARWVDQTEVEPGEITAAYTGGWTGIHHMIEQLQTSVSGFEEHPAISRPRVVTVRELIEQGVLDLAVGRPKEHYLNAPPNLRDRIATVADISNGTLRDTSLEEPYSDYPELTRECDVLAITMHTIRARVDGVGGHLPSTGVHRLRVLNRDVLSPAYLAITLAGSWNERFQAGSTIQRAAIRDLEIPLVPQADQDTIQQAVMSIGQLHEAATRLADYAATANTALLDAVRYNAPLATPAADSVSGTQQDEPHRTKDTK